MTADCGLKTKKMTRLLLLTLPIFSLAQTPTQTLRGKVVDAISLQPLVGATVALLESDPPLGSVTDEKGNYEIPGTPIGDYRMQVSFLGYETLVVAEIQVEAGRETVQDIRLREQPEALGEVTVRAQGTGSSGHPVSLRTLTVEEQFRYPVTFFDPARVAASYPGVSAPDDQANHLSIRGNSPNAVRWRVEGVDIVNPNHTANAGTFSDRPSSAGGGVSILSAQVLGVSNFLTGAFPTGYGNSIGGVMDMRFRKGNNSQRQFVAQAGVIGLEGAAEGPFLSPQPTVSSPQSGRGASFLLNYRYSFTGLLTSFGVDFGGEEIGFQDVSFHLNFPTEKAGEFGIFGLGGKSKNIFTSPLDSLEIKEDKERFDIDFQSKMGALGVTHVLPLGKKGVLRSVAALSALEHVRTADWVALIPEPIRWDEDEITERKLALSSIFTQKISARSQWRAGVQASQEHSDFYAFANDNFGAAELRGTVDGWLVQPFAEWQKWLAPRWELVAGAQLSHFTFSEKTVLEPRASLRFLAAPKSQFSLAYGLHSQTQTPQLQALSADGEKLGFNRSHHLVFGYRQNLRERFVLDVEAYYQHLFDLPVSAQPERKFSVVNLTEFTDFKDETLVSDGTARNYGLDLSLQEYWNNGSFGLLSGSWYRSLYTAADGVERPTRWDGRYTLNLVYGQEWTKLKNSGKTRALGYSIAYVWLGGFRQRPISISASDVAGRTVFLASADFTERLKNYKRMDVRLYIKWERPNRTSLLSLDVQNLLNEENEAFRFFDVVQRRSAVRYQLGVIPVLSWRMEFQ